MSGSISATILTPEFELRFVYVNSNRLHYREKRSDCIPSVVSCDGKFFLLLSTACVSVDKFVCLFVCLFV